MKRGNLRFHGENGAADRNDEIRGPSGHPKRLLIIGNGPSTRRLAEYGFHKISEQFHTFGMGAAYRYFYLVGWWPTYYAWCDQKVVHSHRAALTRLIHNPEVTTKRFYFSLPITEHERFEVVPHSSTGDFCFNTALKLGYDEVYFIGIEGNYIEEISNSRELNESERNKLRKVLPDADPKRFQGMRIVESTTPIGQNYFFPWYQQQGDIYSLPRSEKHRSFWEKCWAEARTAGVAAFNLSPQSLIGGFEKKAFDAFLEENAAKRPTRAAVQPTNIGLIAFPTLRTPAERDFWNNVCAAMRERGYRPIILSYFASKATANDKVGFAEQFFLRTHPDSVVGLPEQDEDSQVSAAVASLAGYSAVHAYYRENPEKFNEAFAIALQIGSRAVAKVLSRIIDVLNPRLIALNNDTHQIPILVEELARQREIPLFHTERSPLVTNWIEQDGFYAQAQAWSAPTAWLDDPTLDEVGAAAVKRLADRPAMHRDGTSKQAQGTPATEPFGSIRPLTILIAMDAVLNTGWAVPGNPKRPLNYPLFDTPQDAVRAIVAAGQQIGAKVLLKPHPSGFPFDGLTDFEGATVYTGSIEDALDQADIVACFLTKVAFAAIAQQKKVVSLAPQIAALSGLVFHCASAEEIERKLREALKHEWSTADDVRLRRFFGWLERDYFVSNDLSNPAAQKFLDRYFPPLEPATGNYENLDGRLRAIPGVYPKLESIEPGVAGERTASMLYGPFARVDDCLLDEVNVVLNLFRAGVLVPQRERGMMIDVGACKGRAFAEFARMGWEVHAFEPNPPMYAHIKEKALLPGVTLNQLAVSEKSGEELPFYTSEESVGISSLSPFRDSHKPTAIVKTVRLDDYYSEKSIGYTDFLKVDTEGFDLMVLRSLDWETVRPQTIVCEFEDAKTEKLGYRVEDMAALLLDRGYTVFVSEWHPITRYGGGEHRWRALRRWQAGELPEGAWGNLIAFRDSIADDLVTHFTWQTLEVARLRRLAKAKMATISNSAWMATKPLPIVINLRPALEALPVRDAVAPAAAMKSPPEKAARARVESGKVALAAPTQKLTTRKAGSATPVPGSPVPAGGKGAAASRRPVKKRRPATGSPSLAKRRTTHKAKRVKGNRDQSKAHRKQRDLARSREGFFQTWPVAIAAIVVALVLFVTAGVKTSGESLSSLILFVAGASVMFGILHDSFKRRLQAYRAELQALTRAVKTRATRREKSLLRKLKRAEKWAARRHAETRKALGSARTEAASSKDALNGVVAQVRKKLAQDRGETNAALDSIRAEVESSKAASDAQRAQIENELMQNQSDLAVVKKGLEAEIKQHEQYMMDQHELRQAVENLSARIEEELIHSNKANTALRAELREATQQMIAHGPKGPEHTRIANNALGRVPFKMAFPAVLGPNAQNLYVDKGRLAFSPRHGETEKKVVVNTIPKSGTYLVAALLERLGVVDTKVHLFDTYFHDFRNRLFDEVLNMPTEFNVFVPLDQSARLIHEGQFAVGHIDYRQANASILRDFVQLHCIRNLRDVLVSHMRFILDPRLKTPPAGDWWRGRDGAQLFIAYLNGPAREYITTRILPTATWFQKSGVLTLRFEELIGDNGEVAQRHSVEVICDKLGLPVPADVLTILQQEVIGNETRTYTGRRSDHRNYWNDEVEELFRDLGLVRANAALGY